MRTTNQRAADSTLKIDLDLWVELTSAVCWQAALRLHEAVAAFERPADVTLTLRAFERRRQPSARVSTFDAQRLCALALEQGGPALQSATAERFWTAHLTQRLAIGDPHVLQRAAAECGLDEGRVATVLAGDELSARVRDDEQLAASLGIATAPTLVANGVVVDRAMPEAADYLVLLREVATGATT